MFAFKSNFYLKKNVENNFHCINIILNQFTINKKLKTETIIY